MDLACNIFSTSTFFSLSYYYLVLDTLIASLKNNLRREIVRKLIFENYYLIDTPSQTTSMTFEILLRETTKIHNIFHNRAV